MAIRTRDYNRAYQKTNPRFDSEFESAESGREV
jgi:hypothetical protein